MKTRGTQNTLMFLSLLMLSFMLGFELSKLYKEPTSYQTFTLPYTFAPSPHLHLPERFPATSQPHQHRHPLPSMQGPQGHYHPHGKWNFRKIGFLTSREMADPIIMPLFGEPAPYRRHRYNYYTVNDTHNAISAVNLPLYHKDRDCTDEVACDEIYSGDLIRVHGYEAPFVAEVY